MSIRPFKLTADRLVTALAWATAAPIRPQLNGRVLCLFSKGQELRPKSYSRFTVVFVSLALLGGMSLGSSVRACSCEYPDIGYLADPEIEIPSNARGLMWAGVISSAGLVALPPPETFRVESWSGTGWIEVKHSVSLIRDPRGQSRSPYDVLLVAPVDGVTGGQRLRFTCHARDGRALGSAHRDSALAIQVVNVSVSHQSFKWAQQDLNVGPIQTGVLRLAAGASCSAEVEAKWVEVEDVLSPSIWKWKDSLFYSVVVGSSEWGDRYWHPRANLCDALPPGRSWAGYGRERFYQLLEPRASSVREAGFDVEAGSAIMIAWLPGTSSVIRTTVRFSNGSESQEH